MYKMQFRYVDEDEVYSCGIVTFVKDRVLILPAHFLLRFKSMLDKGDVDYDCIKL